MLVRMATPRELKRLVKFAIEEGRSFEDTVAGFEHSMLSPAEAYFIYLFTRLIYKGDGVIAELGSYTGGLACVIGEALQRGKLPGRRLEIYEFFEHSDLSREMLKDDPLFNPRDFFEIWERNVDAYRKRIKLFRGDFRETASDSSSKIELLFVDIIKHGSMINPFMRSFVPRLVPGGILVHQDYFHWQSPWVVYATEAMADVFEFLGAISNHSAVFRLAGELPQDLVRRDFIDGLSDEDKLMLMRRAIERFGGIQRALLEVSRLNLGAEMNDFAFEEELSRVRAAYEQPRVQTYLDQVELEHQRLERGRRRIW